MHGVAVCDDAPTFERIVARISSELSFIAGHLPSHRWEVVEGYRGPAYGVATEAMRATIRRVARTEGLLLDTSYTGKAMHALVCEALAGRWTGRVLFWHTGGAFSLFAQGPELLSDATGESHG
ncbi:MAG: D-cysteine desulfhydrase [Kiritimatiellia bacterium]